MSLLLRIYYLLALYQALPAIALANQTISVDTNDATLTANVYPANGTVLYLWLPPEGGFLPTHIHIAQALNSFGIEGWLVDLFEGRFLPPVASSLGQIPASDVSHLLVRAQKVGKDIILVSSGRGTLPLLRGAHHWQRLKTGPDTITGVILLSPQFYIDTPDPGEAAELHPIVSHTNLPIFILQPKLSPWFWKLDQTVPALQSAGSDVYVRTLPAVRDRFYYRPDASPAEQQITDDLPQLLRSPANCW